MEREETYLVVGTDHHGHQFYRWHRIDQFESAKEDLARLRMGTIFLVEKKIITSI